MLKRLLASAALGAMFAPMATSAAHAQTEVAQSDQHLSASAQLKALFTASDEASLKRNPIMALFRSDTRYADQFGDYVSDAYFAAEKAAAQADLAELSRIDRTKLSSEDQISYDVFKWQRETDLEGYSDELLAVSKYLAIDHFNGLHQFVPDIFSGSSVVKFKTVKDYEDNLKRLDGFVANMDGVLNLLKQGVAKGIVQPRLVSDRVLDQLNRHVDGDINDMPLLMPVQNFSADIPAAEQTRLKAAYEAKLRDDVMPRYRALRDFMRDTYIPASRGNEKPGLLTVPGGKALYDYKVKSQTTTNLSAEEIHNIGLSEVKRIHGEMAKVMKQVGFKGDLKAFFNFLRTDPQFKAKSREVLTQGYYDIGKRVDVMLPKLFSTIPKTPLEIRPYPEFLEKDSAGGSYMPGAPDASRPGIFYFNAYDLPSRTTPGMETLYLHEGAPGHHFQIALAYENDKLPNFQRFGGNTAFIEGWALYAESLGKELGMLTDPYQYFGRLDDEMLRAMRLVADTGMHAKGWSRQQAIDFYLDNSSQGETDVVNEIDRYIAMPGQALAYKMGDLRIQAARKRAEKALGKKFDIKKFHEQILMSGALPLEIMDQKIDRWIKAGGN